MLGGPLRNVRRLLAGSSDGELFYNPRHPCSLFLSAREKRAIFSGISSTFSSWKPKFQFLRHLQGLRVQSRKGQGLAMKTHAMLPPTVQRGKCPAAATDPRAFQDGLFPSTRSAKGGRMLGASAVSLLYFFHMIAPEASESISKVCGGRGRFLRGSGHPVAGAGYKGLSSGCSSAQEPHAQIPAAVPGSERASGAGSPA